MVMAIAAQVPDPELPMLTLADLGILRSIEIDEEQRVRVTITPTYSGCPALEAMRVDLRQRLNEAGYRDVEVRIALSPAWSTDWITERGLRKLAEHGIAPPGPRHTAPVALSLDPPAVRGPAEVLPMAVPSVWVPTVVVPCPHCGATATTELSRFGATACTALRRCTACQEPFTHVKAI
ncbi:MAG: 1,2-phenylacetyl-CoA epoxidase subunit PaaD [Pseudonocardiales bacterium]